MNSQVSVFENILQPEDIAYFLTNTQVLEAKSQLDAKEKGTIDISIEIPLYLREHISSVFQIDITQLNTLPLRWIKGDTPSHSDRATANFEYTYLAYLTNSPGEFIIDNQPYGITQGSAYIFSEGVQHETINTGSEPRLLLGPMNEMGMPVGIGSSLTGPGGTSVYLKMNEDSTAIIYSYNQSDWSQLTTPVYIQNTDTEAGIFTVEFVDSIILLNANDYFICYSDNIQFGSASLNSEGNRSIITVNVTGHGGLIENGTSGNSGFNNIYVYNLFINSEGDSVDFEGGWIGRSYYGNSGSNNYIINCATNGNLGNGCGGIVGSHAAKNGTLTIIGCSSSGQLSQESGGIVGSLAGQNGNVLCKLCFSTGIINGDGAGGIVGANCYTVQILKCYSEGTMIGNNTGGIVGANAGINSVEIINCYSRGNIIGANSGGICGSVASLTSVSSISISNCYSTGNINNSVPNSNGGIIGILITSSPGSINLVISNCYATGTVVISTGYIIGNRTVINGSNASPVQYVLVNNFSEAGSPGGTPGSWSDSKNTLTGKPTGTSPIGTTWVKPSGVNLPYELGPFGYTPYSTLVIVNNDLVQTANESVPQGSVTTKALTGDASGNDFSILQITGGTASSYANITMNKNSGRITVSAVVVPGTYTLTIRSVGSYNITEFDLIVLTAISADTACCAYPLDLKNADYTTRAEVISGNVILANRTENRKGLSYSDIIKMSQAYASKHF